MTDVQAIQAQLDAAQADYYSSTDCRVGYFGRPGAARSRLSGALAMTQPPCNPSVPVRERP